ncbi:cupin domain-containing protein [Salinicola sp. JS01]|uniref:cupin domain-containing protein n=1 Tax=Salinicola sp. JS01 TaxID=3050071 RepID=UPI00255B8248|nr:cupin domain-containing protein [Salinicola sp. JS01]WIX34968.1 cupin domain-containing protein [Salinicola sp. JS01]
MGLAEIAPEGILPLHQHDPAEIYHILSGEGQMEIEGVTFPLYAGQSVFIPQGHGIKLSMLVLCRFASYLHFRPTALSRLSITLHSKNLYSVHLIEPEVELDNAVTQVGGDAKYRTQHRGGIRCQTDGRQH